MWALVGGLSGLARMAIGGFVVFAICYFVIIPLERSDARKGYVLLAEKTAAEAQAAELRRQINATAQSLEEHRRRLAAAEVADQQQTEEREREIAAYEIRLDQASRRCVLDRDDVEFLRRH